MHLTHLNARGEAHMVDIADKDETRREAVAGGTLSMRPATLALLAEGGLPKGDVLATARIAGIQAAKRTHELIPLCHALALSKVSVEFHFDSEKSFIEVIATCRLSGRTGVEMEALTAVSVACLTLYDMCKAVDKDMQIGDIRLLTKSGGKSGDYRRQEAPYRASAQSITGQGYNTGNSTGVEAALGLSGDMRHLRVKFLAELRERLGVSELEVPIEKLSRADVASLKALLKTRDSSFALLEEGRILCAINQVMGGDDTPLTEGDEVAFFPPVTGG